MSGNRRTSGVCHTRGCRRSRDAYCSSFRDSACGSLPLTVPRLNWIFPLTSARAFLRESGRLPPWKLLRLRAPPSLILFRSSVSFSSRVAHSFRSSIAIISISTFSIPRLLYHFASFSFYLHLPIFWSFFLPLFFYFFFALCFASSRSSTRLRRFDRVASSRLNEMKLHRIPIIRI